jgi:hypothetical protein
MPGAFDPEAFDSEMFDTGHVWMETSANDHRADEVIKNVADFARAQLAAYGM